MAKRSAETLRQRNKGLYWAWKAMKQRCQNPRCHAYHNYGARGITVCEEWQKFEPFCEWALENGYQKGLDLDRRDNDGNYSPDNCRWITRRENTNNRRNTIMIDVDGVILPETVWSERLGIGRTLIKQWMKNHGAEYTASRIRDIQQNGYVPKNYSYGHGYPVIDAVSCERFPSVRAAARHYNVSPGVIRRQIGKGRFTWEAA